ncbi:MAG: hypothetical protein ACKO85_17760, partial [Isosphaeraceae bacterium]
ENDNRYYVSVHVVSSQAWVNQGSVKISRLIRIITKCLTDFDEIFMRNSGPLRSLSYEISARKWQLARKAAALAANFAKKNRKSA